jgi:hypothetical protein
MPAQTEENIHENQMRTSEIDDWDSEDWDSKEYVHRPNTSPFSFGISSTSSS